MSKEHLYMKDLHGEHKEWLSEVQLYREEALSFKNRLEEIATQNTGKEVLAPLEQLQNQLIRHNEVIDTIEHDINLHEKELAQYAENHPIAVDHKYFSDHTTIRTDVENERKIFTEFKGKIKNFLAKSF